MSASLPGTLARFFTRQGLLGALLLLCASLSFATLAEQYPGGAPGGKATAGVVLGRFGKGVKVAVVAGTGRDDGPFVQALEKALLDGGAVVVGVSQGPPHAARALLAGLAAGGRRPEVIAASHAAGRWTLLEDVGEKVEGLQGVPVVAPRPYRWPNFLKSDNLLNIANQISVIAVLAVGMTVVIVTGGIDLSVGSLIALSAVTAALLIVRLAGAEHATPAGMVLCCAAAVAATAAVGAFSGLLITRFDVPPFLVTLGTMLVASGLAFIVASGQSIYRLPDAFVWLGRGADLLNVPNAVVLMLLLYLAAHVVMTRTVAGRHLYAVGGNREAARLSGVPVRRVVMLAYVVSGATAGLGGVMMASQLQSAAPTYGETYELFVIAAVVVGGTSLSGGEGNVFGTLVGAFFIAVIQNGMNLTGVESYTQKVVLGAVILLAAVLDRLKKGAWNAPALFTRRNLAPVKEVRS
jgi:ribose transport system permease protein